MHGIQRHALQISFPSRLTSNSKTNIPSGRHPQGHAFQLQLPLQQQAPQQHESSGYLLEPICASSFLLSKSSHGHLEAHLQQFSYNDPNQIRGSCKLDIQNIGKKMKHIQFQNENFLFFFRYLNIDWKVCSLVYIHNWFFNQNPSVTLMAEYHQCRLCCTSRWYLWRLNRYLAARYWLLRKIWQESTKIRKWTDYHKFVSS